MLLAILLHFSFPTQVPAQHTPHIAYVYTTNHNSLLQPSRHLITPIDLPTITLTGLLIPNYSDPTAECRMLFVHFASYYITKLLPHLALWVRELKTENNKQLFILI